MPLFQVKLLNSCELNSCELNSCELNSFGRYGMVWYGNFLFDIMK